MNSEVEVHVGQREGVLAVPNSALRTQRDVGSAARGARPLGRGGAAGARRGRTAGGSGAAPGSTLGGTDGAASRSRTTLRDGGPSRCPPAYRGAGAGGDDQAPRGRALTASETAILDGSGRARGRRRRQEPGAAAAVDASFGGRYIVFVKRPGGPTAGLDPDRPHRPRLQRGGRGAAADRLGADPAEREPGAVAAGVAGADQPHHRRRRAARACSSSTTPAGARPAPGGR